MPCAPTTRPRRERADPLSLYYIILIISSWLWTVKTGDRFRFFFARSRTKTIDIAMTTDVFDPKIVLELDPWLEPFLSNIDNRYQKFKAWKDKIAESEGGYDQFTKGYLKFGLNVQPDNSVLYREWAPNAISAALTGDFSLSLIGIQSISDTDARMISTRRVEQDLSPYAEGGVRCLGSHHTTQPRWNLCHPSRF